MNNSSTSGILSPSLNPDVLEGEKLVDFFQNWVASITGMPGQYVRPRWQAEPPNIPASNIDWCAIGIKRRESDTYVSEVHVSADLGYNELRRHEILHFLISFYGPRADLYSELFREGVQVAQNREILTLHSMGLVETGEVVTVPEMIKDKWLNRLDLDFSIRRQIVRHYAVQNLNSADVSVNGNEMIVSN